MDILVHQQPPWGLWNIYLEDATKQKSGVYQLDFFGVFLHANINNRVFVKLDSRYTYYFTDYSKYFGIDLRLLKSLYIMANSGNLFSDELT